jgi:hypothetical protein
MDLENPQDIVDGIERDPLKLCHIYKELDPKIVEEIFRIMKTSKEDMESLNTLKQMGML